MQLNRIDKDVEEKETRKMIKDCFVRESFVNVICIQHEIICQILKKKKNYKEKTQFKFSN